MLIWRGEVIKGTTYEGKYFQLACDIDLGNKEWTPIGTTNNSFMGIFDGAGHTIANAKVTISNLPSGTYDSYGIFGSVGGGNNKSIIRNLELSGINIDITASGATGSWTGQSQEGMHIGIMSGSIYKNTNIVNVIVKNSSITDSNVIDIYNSKFQLSIGGVVGYVTNTSTSDADPGENNRYVIENCFADTTIDIDATAQVNTGLINRRDGRGHYHTGGIIGTIRSQPVWPSHCFYQGNINSNGFIGPIFAALINNTDYSSSSGFGAIWNGNDAGALTVNNMYYSTYTAAGTAFTQSVTSGTSRARKSNTASNVGYVQGVNKGTYTTNMNTILDMFNTNVSTENKYVNWLYTNGTFSFKERLTATVEEPQDYTYEIQIEDLYQIGTYAIKWYKDGVEDSSIQGTTYVWTPSYDKSEDIIVIINDGEYYTVTKFLIRKISVDILFDIDENNNSVVATLEGEGLKYTTIDDYVFQWYEESASGDLEPIEGATTLTLTGLEENKDYRLVATNSKMPKLNTQNSFTYGEKIVVYVDYNNGDNNNNGYTDKTPVKTLNTAYIKLDSNGNRDKNIIVIMGTYTNTNFWNLESSTIYNKNATITGKYKNKEYNGVLYFYITESIIVESTYRYMTADTTFEHLIFYGNRNSMYLYLQGHSLTIGESVTMNNYGTASSKQGLLGNNAPAFHIICGWLRYNYAKLPNNNAEVLIKSGTYGRIIGGGSPGTTSVSNLQQNTSHNFMGSSMEDIFKVNITVDIEKSTTDSKYDYDINLLVGGSACGNNYSKVTENIKSGTIGRLLGASIGDSSNRPSDWNYPINTFLGETTVNILGGKITELYGGCLGRNMNALSGTSSIICDSYFYGTVNINVIDGDIENNIYGAGAGGVTGYSENSSDLYKSYGQSISTSVNVNISGGRIGGNIYGGGYGYTEYLTEAVTATDGGALYGNSNIKISGSPIIKGNIFAAGCGYELPSKPNLAQMEGNSRIEISGTPTIQGKIFGAGAGINGYSEMAKLKGTSEIKIAADLSAEVYGGGNIAKTEGNTNIQIENGNHTADIYGGGNIGIIDGNTEVNINGGTQNRVFGGGNQAQTTNSVININGGNTNEIYGGGNSASVDITNVHLKGGTVTTVYGGSNQTGTVKNSNVETLSGTVQTIYGGNNIGGNTEQTEVIIKGGSILTAVYGGGNQVDTTKTNIDLQSSQDVIPNVFGGGNQAGVNESYVYCNGANINNVFGGSNSNGTVNKSYLEVNRGTIENVYGGNNQGGITQESNIITNGGEVTDVYGGGEQATTNLTNVQIRGRVQGRVFGGGNQAGVNTNTNLTLEGATVENNVYGGGNEGTVTGDTYVHCKNSTLKNSLYAGGNGSTAIVYGNTNLVMDGTDNKVTGSVFGGGNKAATGEQDKNTSKSTVNIVGAQIGKNVYGGANTSVVYGTTQTNIGYDTVNDSSLEIGKVEITGTVFGGGEANEAGDENYDFSFISVTKGIDIQINGNGHKKFSIKGSIFGSGNASSTSGESFITIQNYGTADSPQSNVSIQRANCATISNSAISLSGATDRTNEYSQVFFSISRVDKVKVKNNSILYLCNGANLLKELDSLVDEDGNEVKGAVTINSDTGETTKNVDNRIYMLEDKNLNIATNEQATAYGQVQGMFFFGLFTNKVNPSTSTGFYNQNYENGDTIINAGTFSSNSYVMAQHMVDHDTTIDGFYTNYNEQEKIKVKYIETTPKDDVYYIWLVGEEMDVTKFEVNLIASKYATLGTYELLLKGFSDPNIKFSISGFSAGLENGISLVNPNEIEAIAPDENTANTVYGLSMKTGNTGWQTKGTTIFLTENGGSYQGTNDYEADNSTYTPTFNICFYHSENITVAQNLGDVKVRLQVLKPIDDLNYQLSYIDINITLSSALYQNDFYEAAITPGQEFGLFTTTETNITSRSNFSTYYSLFMEDFSNSKYFDNYKSYKRVIVSRDSRDMPYVFPENTKLTMLDMVTNQYYYYIVTAQDVSSNKYVYSLSDFIAMGSNDNKFDEEKACENYYNQEQNLTYENFIFHISFADSSISENIQNNSLLMELRDNEGQTLVGVLGIQRNNMVYTVYTDKEATIEIDGTVNPETVYLGNIVNLNVKTVFTQTVVNSKTIYDTQYFDKKLGIRISFYDSNGNRLNNDSLLGVNFELDGKLYYPRIDGTTRINIANKVTDVLARIKLHTERNKTLATGNYKIKIESFGCADGIYYGLTPSDSVELNLRIINSSYGLKVITGDKEKIIDKETGYNLNGNNSLVTAVEYSSSLSNPKIAISLYRRSYEEEFSQNYTLVDLKDYILNNLAPTKRENEYLVSENPVDKFNNFLRLKPHLKTGTYKIVYKLYDNDTYVGEAYEYMVIK